MKQNNEIMEKWNIRWVGFLAVCFKGALRVRRMPRTRDPWWRVLGRMLGWLVGCVLGWLVGWRSLKCRRRQRGWMISRGKQLVQLVGDTQQQPRCRAGAEQAQSRLRSPVEQHGQRTRQSEVRKFRSVQERPAGVASGKQRGTCQAGRRAGGQAGRQADGQAGQSAASSISAGGHSERAVEENNAIYRIE